MAMWHGSLNCPLFATLYVASIQRLAYHSLTGSSYEVLTEGWRIADRRDFERAQVRLSFLPWFHVLLILNFIVFIG